MPSAGRSMAARAAPASSSAIRRPISRAGSTAPEATSAQQRRVVADRHPVHAERSRARGEISAAIGTRDRASSPASSRPTWTWRPRWRRQRDRARQRSAALPDRVERDVRAAAGQLADRARTRRRRARRRRGRRRARRRAPSGAGATSTATTRAPSGRGDHHRREADAAAAVDREPVAGPDAAVLADAAKAVMKRQPSAAAVDEARARRAARTKLRSARGDRDALGERAPAREARLVVALADLGRGPAGTARRRRSRSRTGRSRGRRLSRRVTSAPTAVTTPGELVPGHVGQGDRRVVAHPAVPVAAAEAGGADLDRRAPSGAGARARARSSMRSGSRKACMTAARIGRQ